MPLDCIWVDIDYADGKKYFVWDKKQFPSPHDMLSLVKQHKRRLVTIVDPHVKVDESYFLYKIAKQRGLLVKTDEGSDYIAKCWPGDSVWLDFTNPLTTELLTEIYTGFHAEEMEDFIWTDAWVHIWNDMNEPAVFEPTDKTFPKGNLHYGNVEHRDIHNVYGHDNAKATYKALAKRGNMRPFVLTRSFYAGTQ